MYSEINTNEISVFKSWNLIPFNDNGISAKVIIALNIRDESKKYLLRW